MSNEHSPLRDAEFMPAFLDVVIPPSDDGKLPGAGALGLANEVADAVEGDGTQGPAAEDGLRAIRQAAVEREGGFAALAQATQVELIESQLAAHPTLMSTVTRYLYFAYYQHPTVLAALGEPPRPRFPGGFEVDETDPRLLEKLRTRQQQ